MRRTHKFSIVTLIFVGIFLYQFFRNSNFGDLVKLPRGVAQAVSSDAQPATGVATDNSPFGMPSAGGDSNDCILQDPFFVSSYNNSLGGPNWVAWRLVAADIGDAPRLPFYAGTLPNGFRVIKPDDYTGSGFDRGHQCNHEDRSSTNEASKATFTMTNMLPQAPNLNRKTWEHLEEYSRKLAKRGNTLFIVCGGIGTGGVGDKGAASALKGKVNVPASCWKVVLVTDGSSTPNKNWQMIGVIMPNRQDIDLNWQKYVVPVGEIEAATGLNFFPNIGTDHTIEQLKALRWK